MVNGLDLRQFGLDAQSGLGEESVDERAGRYWMRLSRFFMMAASWHGVLQEPTLPRLFFMFAQAPSVGLP
jgi:hypothetical protein